ncbi:MAG: DUF2512 family protein [Desulfocucumaceae bacterium]
MIKIYTNIFFTKFLLFAPVIGLVLPIIGGIDTKVSLGAAFLAALASFLTADLVLYPRYGNLPALLADVIITILVLLEMFYLLGQNVSISALAVTAVLIGVGEWYFHRYMGSVLFSRRRR